MRRIKKSDYIANSKPYATFTCGSGVRLKTMYPFRRDLIEPIGPKRPSNAKVNDIKRFGAQLRKAGGEWQTVWSLAAARKFCLHVLYHEVGHHVDWYYRHWSAANLREVEEAAEQYAFAKTATASYVFNRLNKRTEESA